MNNLNDLECVAIYDSDTKQLRHYQWTLVLTPAMITEFSCYVFPLIRKELQTGRKQALADGRTLFRFILNSHKTTLFRQSLLHKTKPHVQVNSSVEL